MKKKLMFILAILFIASSVFAMKVYLTNSAGSGQAQTNPNASLGGYRSTTELSAVSMKNLFDNVSIWEALLGDIEYRMIDIYNDGATDALRVQFYMRTPTSSPKTELNFGYSATAQPHADAWNGEALANESTAPASPAMTFANYTKTAPVALGTIPAGKSARICVKRTVTAGAGGWTAQDLGSFGLRWGAAAGTTFCSTCTGSGASPSFCWAVDEDVADAGDITTTGDACVVSGADSTVDYGSNVDFSAAPAGKTGYAVDVGSTGSPASDRIDFDVTSEDLITDTAGTIQFDVYFTADADSWVTNLVLVGSRPAVGTDEVYVGTYGADGAGTREFRLNHEGNNGGVDYVTSDTTDITKGAWHTVTAEWEIDRAGGTTLSIDVDGDTATDTDTLAAFTTQPTLLSIGNTNSSGGATARYYIKNVKVWKTWQ